MTQTVHRQKTWPYIIFIILGLLLMFIPKFSTYASIAFEVLLGWIFTLGALLLILLLFVFKLKKAVLMWVIAIVFLITGLYFLTNPLSAAKLMTWIFAALTLINGIGGIFQSFFFRGRVKTVFLVNGLIGILFAVMIWVNWPLSGTSFIGILLGVNLFLTGLTHLMFRRKDS